MIPVSDYTIPVNETYQLEGWEFDFAADHFLRNENVEFYRDDGFKSEVRATAERQGKEIAWRVIRDGTVTWLEVSTKLDIEEFVDNKEYKWKKYLSSMTDDRVSAIENRAREVYGLN